MSEDVASDTSRAAPSTAGTLLREARQAQGMHIAALAATIKVAQRKLESLEADRLDELPDATFTRALAQAVCRALKIEPAPVLALLPAASGSRLDHVSEGINEPFRERPARLEPDEWAVLRSPWVGAAILLVVAAGVVYLLPPKWLSGLTLGSGASAPESATSDTASAVVPSGSVVEPVDAGTSPSASASASASSVEPPSTPSAELSSAPPAASSPAPALPIAAAPVASASPAKERALLQLHAVADSWVEVHDAQAQVLLSRNIPAGESVALDGVMPLRVKIGNARATEVIFRGRQLDLAPNTRDNVARLELK
jgi:cytoskeleton protein RodZ